MQSTKGYDADAAGLDEESFQEFVPLLAACQEYARNNRYGFKASDFTKLPSTPTSCATCQSAESGRLLEQLQGKLQAASAVSEYTDRLQSAIAARNENNTTHEQQVLLDQLDQAFHIVIRESVRHMMKSTCVGLSLYPPSPSPGGVDSNDCCYEDVSAPLPVIAQRLCNDEEMMRNTPCGTALRRRARTAHFILDFAEEVGVAMPAMPDQYAIMLQEFEKRVGEWQQDLHGVAEQTLCQEKGLVAVQSAVQEKLALLPSFLAGANATIQGALASATSSIQEAIPTLQDIREPECAMPLSAYAEQFDVSEHDLMFYY